MKITFCDVKNIVTNQILKTVESSQHWFQKQLSEFCIFQGFVKHLHDEATHSCSEVKRLSFASFKSVAKLSLAGFMVAVSF